MEGVDAIEVVRLAIGGVLVAVGVVFLVGGAIGMLRFPDLYTRLHGASVANPHGAALVVIGLAIAAPSAAVSFKLAALALLLFALGPVWSHLFASAAHAGGLAPVTGRYATPRPGARAQQGEMS